jgi:S1-C subfamily serine protease
MKFIRRVGPRAASSGWAVFVGALALILLALASVSNAAGPAGTDLEQALIANKWSWAKGKGKGNVWRTTLTFHEDGTITNRTDHRTWYWWVIDDRTAHLEFHREPGAPSTPNFDAGMNLVFSDDLKSFRGTYIPDPESPPATGERKEPKIAATPAEVVEPQQTNPPTPPSTAKSSSDGASQDYNSSLIIVKANEGAASGFIGKSGQSTYLFTNIHVLADLGTPTFTRLDGVAASTGGAELAAGRDIARFAVKNPPDNPLEISTDFNGSVRIGDEVVVTGNSGGGGVATMIKGALLGIGPDRIEVSAPFIPGNSGSPIIHVKTGKVIGIATYLTMRNEDPTKNRAVAVRHFGFRIDTADKWERLEWNAFQQDASSVKRVSALTDDVMHFLRALETRRPPDFETETLRRPATDWMKALNNRDLTSRGRRAVTETFVRALQQIVAGDVLALEPRLHYTYFRDEMREQHEIRRQLYDGLIKESQEMSQR